MTAVIILAVLALVFGAVWFYLANHPGRRAQVGPDGTNVREPETFVVHHEGKGQGLDISNTALKARTEDARRDLPGDAHKVKTPVPGRDAVRMDAPPSDVSRYGADNHRDVELAADLLPNVFPGTGRRVDRDLAVSPFPNGQEPGYDLGPTGPRRPDGEGGDGDDDRANTPYPTEQPDLVDDIPDIPEGDMPMESADKESLNALKDDPVELLFEADETLPNVAFDPDPSLKLEVSEEHAWSHLFEEVPLPDMYGEDMTVALVRNPRSLYVYWERNGYGDENLRAMLGAQWNATVPVLRVFDLTTGAYPGQRGGHSFAIQVGETDNHWFINDGILPGRRYVVSYERMEPSGHSHLISHSAPVQTPHEAPVAVGAARSLLYERYGGALSEGGRVSSWRQTTV